MGSPTSGTAPLTVTFTDQSTNSPTSWSWTFGDGGTSTARNPSHTYAAAGTYTVALTATNAGGSDTETKIGYITVTAPRRPRRQLRGHARRRARAAHRRLHRSLDEQPDLLVLDLRRRRDLDRPEPQPHLRRRGHLHRRAHRDQRRRLRHRDQGRLHHGHAPPAAAGRPTLRGTPTSGTAPLAVTFTDHSTNSPTVLVLDLRRWRDLHRAQSEPHLRRRRHLHRRAHRDQRRRLRHRDQGRLHHGHRAAVAPVADFVGHPEVRHVAARRDLHRPLDEQPDLLVLDLRRRRHLDRPEPEPHLRRRGTYTVALTATNAGGSDTETKIGLHHGHGPAAAGARGGLRRAPPGPARRRSTVTFTDQSTNSPTSWSWTFGDGGTSTARNPSHTYAAGGHLHRGAHRDQCRRLGHRDQGRLHHRRTPPPPPPPVADFVGTPTSGTAPLTVTFTDQSTNSPTAWSWNFGDGGTSTAQNPSHTYTAAGTYTVSLTATNAGGSDTETKIGLHHGDHAARRPGGRLRGQPDVGHGAARGDLHRSVDEQPDGLVLELRRRRHLDRAEPEPHLHRRGHLHRRADRLERARVGHRDEDRLHHGDAPHSPPVASFVGSPTSGTAPLTVAFSDRSTNTPTAWSWDFGDGAISTAASPSTPTRRPAPTP